MFSTFIFTGIWLLTRQTARVERERIT